MDFAGRTEPRPISVKGWFKAAAKALTGDDEDEEPKTRRRRDETEGQFQWLARIIAHVSTVRQNFRGRSAIASRYAPIDAEAYAVATKHLSNTLDMLSQLDGGDGCDFTASASASPNFHSLHL
jgi:hypothetical protein